MCDAVLELNVLYLYFKQVLRNNRGILIRHLNVSSLKMIMNSKQKQNTQTRKETTAKGRKERVLKPSAAHVPCALGAAGFRIFQL